MLLYLDMENVRFIEFGAQPSLGQYIEGAHWKDQSLIHKIKDIAITFFKVALVASAVGLIVWSITIPLVAVIIASALIAIGVGIISHSVYKLYRVDEGVVLPYPDSVTPLGSWSDNHVRVTKDGSESFEMKMRLIESAQHSIEICGIFCGGELFDQALDRIDTKMNDNEELTVRIIADDRLLTKSNHEKINRLKEEYPNFFFLEMTAEIVAVPSLRSMSNHTKFVVVDGMHCITGGTGIQDGLCVESTEEDVSVNFMEWVLGKRARDMDVVISGPLAGTMRHEFYQVLTKWKARTPDRQMYGQWDGSYQAVMGEDKSICEYHVENVPATLIVGSDEQGTENACKLAYIKMIRAAQKTIRIANMNLNRPEILEELKQAALRGVNVQVITNISHSQGPLSVHLFGYVNEVALKDLLELGAECYGYKQSATLYHKKVAVIDDQLTVIGSANFSSCLTTEDENIVVMDSEEVAKQTLQVLDEDITRSERLSPPSALKHGWNVFVRTIFHSTTDGLFQ